MTLTPQPLLGTEDAEFPFWSPDSRSLGYFANGKLMKIDAGGGPPQTTLRAEGARGGAWGSQGDIVFGGRYRKRPEPRVSDRRRRSTRDQSR